MCLVSSSVLAAVGYCCWSRSLVVRFHSGEVYGYFNVPGEVAQALFSAESKGTFLNRTILGRFRYLRLDSTTLGAAARDGPGSIV